MWRIIKFLFTGDWHKHEWEILRRVKINLWDGNIPVGNEVEYECRCKLCGKICVFKGVN